MSLSEKFKLGYEETRERLRRHYQVELEGLKEKEKGESSEKFTGTKSEQSMYGSIVSEEDALMITMIRTDKDTARLLIGGEEIEIKTKEAMRTIETKWKKEKMKNEEMAKVVTEILVREGYTPEAVGRVLRGEEVILEEDSNEYRR